MSYGRGFVRKIGTARGISTMRCAYSAIIGSGWIFLKLNCGLYVPARLAGWT